MSLEVMPEDFWIDNVSKTHGKHNIDPVIWARISKMQNSPIKIIKDVRMGNPNKPHMVLPEGSRGYLIDHPDAFFLTEEQEKSITHCERAGVLPALICGYGEIAGLTDGDYEVIKPFFNMSLADLGCENAINN